MLGCLTGLAMKLPQGLEANGSLKLADKAGPDAMMEALRVVLAGARVRPAEAGVGAAGRMGLSGSVGVLPGAKPSEMPLMPAPRCDLMSSTYDQPNVGYRKGQAGV